MRTLALSLLVLSSACGGGAEQPVDGPAAAFVRLLEAEAGTDQRAWLECFTTDTLEYFRDSIYHDPILLADDGLSEADLELPAIELFARLGRKPEAMTFAHERMQVAEEVVAEGEGWVVRRTRGGRERRYWCRIEDGRWRMDFVRTLAEEDR